MEDVLCSFCLSEHASGVTFSIKSTVKIVLFYFKEEFCQLCPDLLSLVNTPGRYWKLWHWQGGLRDLPLSFLPLIPKLFHKCGSVCSPRSSVSLLQLWEAEEALGGVPKFWYLKESRFVLLSSDKIGDVLWQDLPLGSLWQGKESRVVFLSSSYCTGQRRLRKGLFKSVRKYSCNWRNLLFKPVSFSEFLLL